MSNTGQSDASHVNSEDHVPYQYAVKIVLASFIAVAWYNSIELVILCFATFKRYGGCYFWSLLVASICVAIFALGYFLIFFDIYNSYFSLVIMEIGWCGMVTGQSLVLWARLHLVVYNRKILRATLAMIIMNAIVLHIPGTVLEIGNHSNKSAQFFNGFKIFERIQLIIFSVQEVILSTLYAWEAVRLLKLRPDAHHKRILIELIIINLSMILMDAAIIGIQYGSFFQIHVTCKAMVYSIKLKLEYAILGKLVHISKPEHTPSSPTDLSEFVDMDLRRTQGGDADRQQGGLEPGERQSPRHRKSLHDVLEEPADI